MKVGMNLQLKFAEGLHASADINGIFIHTLIVRMLLKYPIYGMFNTTNWNKLTLLSKFKTIATISIIVWIACSLVTVVTPITYGGNVTGM